MQTKTTTLEFSAYSIESVASNEDKNALSTLNHLIASYPGKDSEGIASWLTEQLRVNKEMEGLKDEVRLNFLKVILLNNKKENPLKVAVNYPSELTALYETINKKFDLLKAEKEKEKAKKEAEEAERLKRMSPKEKKAEKVRGMIRESSIIARKGYAGLQQQQEDEKKGFERLRPDYLEGFLENEILKNAEEEIQHLMQQFAECLLLMRKQQKRILEKKPEALPLPEGYVDPLLSRLILEHVQQQMSEGWSLTNIKLADTEAIEKNKEGSYHRSKPGSFIFFWNKAD